MVRQYRVRGIVQGVCFRASTQQKALELGLRGWVKNAKDGSVCALACGDQEPLKLFEAWLQLGPTYARVDAVEVRDIFPTDSDYPDLSALPADFQITYS